MNQRRIFNCFALFGTFVGICLTFSILNYQQVAVASTQNLESNAIERVENNNQPMLIAKKRRKCNSPEASFYGKSSKLTAAHKTLAFGTKVRVTNRNNGRYVIVTIDNRRPFSRCRVIDVSLGAARRLRMINSGVVPVMIQLIGR